MTRRRVELRGHAIQQYSDLFQSRESIDAAILIDLNSYATEWSKEDCTPFPFRAAPGRPQVFKFPASGASISAEYGHDDVIFIDWIARPL